MSYYKKAKNKYGSRKVMRDGLVFDSLLEYRRWRELLLLERAGKIQDLRRQVSFELIPAQYEEIPTGEYYVRGEKKGQEKIKRVCVEQSVCYVADFVYTEDGRQIVEDSKGFETKDFIIKRKLLLWVHGIKLKITKE